MDHFSEAVTCCNALGLDVYARFTHSRPLENLFFSPFALTVGLSMTLAGARDSTAEEIIDLMHMNRGLFETQKEIVDLVQFLRTDEVDMSVATGAFVRLGFRPSDDYWATVRRVYGGAVHEVDFVENSEVVRRNINTWVRDKTNNQIKEMLSPGSVTSATRLCMVNGIRFSAVWTDPFFPTEIRRHEFLSSEDEPADVDVEMMSHIGEYAYLVDRDMSFTAVEVPHKGGKTSLVIVMPHQRHDFRELEKREELDKLLGLTARMVKTPDVELCLPRLKLDMNIQMDSMLYYMGLSDLFTETANLGGMFGTGQKMHVTEWVHHAVAEMANDAVGSPGDVSPACEPDSSCGTPLDTSSDEPGGSPGRRSSVSINTVPSYHVIPSRESVSSMPPPAKGCLRKGGKSTKRVRSVVRTTLPFMVNRPFVFFVLHRDLSLLLFLGVVKKIS
ncbi:unnamed protein product [Ixodes pacificus]